MHYDSRNKANLDKLAPNTKIAAFKLYDFAVTNNIEILIYETIRTEEQQRQHVANGKSQTMKSYHLVGQALDFVPTSGSATLWDGYGSENIKKFVNHAISLGFEWGGNWSGFVDKCHLQYNYNGYGTDKTPDAPAPTPPAPAPTAPNYRGDSIVDYLNSIGVDSSFNNRKRLAAQNGVLNYSGTAEQNVKLLNIFRNQVSLSGYKGGSLVDYLVSVGIDSSFSNRKKLAIQHGINDYTGTATQNIKLLRLLRGF